MMIIDQQQKPVVLGKLGSTYGIRGWLRVFSSTEKAEDIINYQPWLIGKSGQWQQVELEGWKWHCSDLIVKIKGISDRDAANLLVNYEIAIFRSQLPLLGEEDYYWDDLIGCEVITTKGYVLGKVTEIMETGSNDVLVVQAQLKDAFNMKERLIPFLSGQVVKRVDVSLKQIEVDWDPGF